MHKRPKTYRYFKKIIQRKPFVLLLTLAFGFSMCLIFLRLVSNKDNFSEVLNLCQCKSANRFYDFCYVNSRNSTSIGKKFSCDLVNSLGRLDLLEAPPDALLSISDAIKNESHVVFVSVTSDDHFNFSMSSLKCVRDFYPDHKFILYGLDLSSNYTDLLRDDPNLEFRRFDSTPYPKFVDNSKSYQLKGLILTEVIRDYPILFWINPDIAMRKPNVLKNLFDEVSEYRTSEEYSPMISLSVMDNKNAAAVNRDLLQFFPSSSVDVNQVRFETFFIVKTEYTCKLLKWCVLCSLTEECITSSGSRDTVLNVLLLNDFQETKKYYMKSLATSFVKMKNE